MTPRMNICFKIYTYVSIYKCINVVLNLIDLIYTTLIIETFDTVTTIINSDMVHSYNIY